VSRRCQDLIRSIIQEKDDRLCSKRYKVKDQPPPSRRDYTGHYVYPHDAEDIKAHKWFRDIPWDRLHLVAPPFVPNLKDTDDTHYFDEEDPISDFSVSASHPQPTTEEITCALKKFNRELQILATGYIERPYDSVRLKKVEREIESFNIPEDQKHYLKEFVTYYGRKEKKRPRDRLLRDRELGTKVLELRKRGAFLGYTYRRVRVSKENLAYGSVVASLVKKNNVWHRARLSVH
jgi:protein-serine/threonine kinase